MKPSSFSYESMGTEWSVSIWDSIKDSQLHSLKETIISMSQNFDETYSRFKSDSLVSSLASKTGIVTVPSELVEMLKMYKLFYRLSDGKFTPLVGSVLEDLGYDKNYSLKEKGSINPIPDFDRAVTIVDFQTIELFTPVLLDLGALGKGYFGEKLKAILKSQNIARYLINGSGDICYEGNGEEITVGLEHPLDTSKVIGTVSMEKGSMCSSGSNRRAWGKYHHILDPDSLTSTTEIIASWFIAESAAIADGLATALFLVPPEYFQKKFKFEYLLLNKYMKVKRSKAFDANLY